MCICVCIYVSVYLFLCCKELAHDFGGWQVPGLVVGKLETQESCWCSSSLKGNRFETQEKLLFLFVSKGRENLMSQLKAVKQEDFLLTTEWLSFFLYSGLQLIG